jgi:hypothetical protein
MAITLTPNGICPYRLLLTSAWLLENSFFTASSDFLEESPKLLKKRWFPISRALRLGWYNQIRERKPPMEEDRTDLEPGQGLLLNSAEQLRTHIRVSVREALKAIFEEDIP